MPDVSIDHVATSVEVVDTAAPATDARRLMAEVMEMIAREREAEALRERDGRISDRSWRSDVKPA